MSDVRINQTLAVAAVVLGGLAALVGRPLRDADMSVDAVTVAQWIRARRGVTILDLRTREAFDLFHLPRAQHRVALPDPATLGAGDTIVFVDDGSGAARAAARLLRGSGGTMRWLRGGAEAWTRELLNPTIAEDAPDSAFARFGMVAELSRYFGGLPRVVPPGTTDSARGGVEATVRRGCGFQ